MIAFILSSPLIFIRTDLPCRIASDSGKLRNEDEVMDDIDNDLEIKDEEDIDEVVIEQSNGDRSSKEEKLMFIFQSPNAKRFYRRYAHYAIFLDATYRTTKYALPLYFLVVKTNVNYQVIFSFSAAIL